MSSYFPIEKEEIEHYEPDMDKFLTKVDWTPAKKFKGKASPATTIDVRGMIDSMGTAGDTDPESLSLVGMAKELSGGSPVFPEVINSVLLAVRTGLAVGFFMADKYNKASGLELLFGNASINSSKALQEEFKSKQTTSSAVTAFTFAAYVVWKLGSLKKEDVSKTNVLFEGIPEFSFDGSISSVKCLLFYLCKYLDPKTGLVKDEIEFLTMTLHYFEAVIVHIKERESGLKETEVFKMAKYKMKDSDFKVEGFEIAKSSKLVMVILPPITREDVAGNEEALDFDEQQMERLFAWDIEERQNPYMAFNALPTSTIKFGPAGTGKDLTEIVKCNKGYELSAFTGLPFNPVPFPNLVDEYQGKTAKATKELFLMVRDPRAIWLMWMNDAGKLLGKRGGKNNDAGGIGEFQSEYLKHMEGAEAYWPGGAAIDHLDNFPELIDPAMYSRMQVQLLVDGARTYGEWLKQSFLEWAPMKKEFGDLIDFDESVMVVPGIGVGKKIGQSQIEDNIGDLPMPKDPEIAKIIAQAFSLGLTIKNDAFFAYVNEAVRKLHDAWTSRHERNMFKGIVFRLTNFRQPESWRKDPKVFYHKTLKEKKGMIKLEIGRNLQGKSVSRIRYEEMIKHLDTFALIANTEEQKEIAARVKEMKIQFKAREKFFSDVPEAGSR